MSESTPDEPVNILLVEDNPGDVRLTEEAFKSVDSPVEFHAVFDGREAAEYLRECRERGSKPRPDLILLDLNLPRMDGFEILEMLDEEHGYPPPPVLVLSSSRTKEDVVRSYENDANAYLTKPDDLTEFTSMAQAIEKFWVDTARHPPAPS